MAQGVTCLWRKCGKVYATLCRASRESGCRRLTVPGLMNGEMKTAPTNPPPAPRKPGQGSLRIDGPPGKVLLVELIGS
jgi:hypothetical protein